MLLNIKTGYRGIQKRPQEEIIYLCCTLDYIEAAQCTYFFTDGHAKKALTKVFTKREDLQAISWDVVYKQIWKNTEDDSDKMRRKQAEFLVKEHVPLCCISRIITYNLSKAEWVKQELKKYSLTIEVLVNPKRKFYY